MLGKLKIHQRHKLLHRFELGFIGLVQDLQDLVEYKHHYNQSPVIARRQGV